MFLENIFNASTIRIFDRLIGSFYGFDKELPGSNCYSVYLRLDPFPRMMMAIGKIEKEHEWTLLSSFYSFDIPLPGTIPCQLQHCLRSIHSATVNIPRHRFIVGDVVTKLPWEFRMTIYVFPAGVDDCSLTDINPTTSIE